MKRFFVIDICCSIHHENLPFLPATELRFDDLVMEIACGLHNFRNECRRTDNRQAIPYFR